MKFLIAIVLYRIERKLTPLLKTNLSVSVLPVFPSFPVVDSAARDSALALLRCLYEPLVRSQCLKPSESGRNSLTSKDRTCLQSQTWCRVRGPRSRAQALLLAGPLFLGHGWTRASWTPGCCRAEAWGAPGRGKVRRG